MWGQAMPREMEFVESDKDVLLWAIGGHGDLFLPSKTSAEDGHQGDR